MSRVLVIGIDGMDWPVLEPLMPDLRHMDSVRRNGFAGELPSVFPPDSIPSWVSIFTGLDPSEHGVIESIDYFKKDVKQFSVDTGSFRGRTFWDLAGRAEKRVLVVNPLLAHPPWEVNGVMASGPVFVSGDTEVYPPGSAEHDPPPPLGGIVDFPEKHELGTFLVKTRAETERIVDYTIRLMKSNPWDMAFVTLLTLDRMFHFFWRYFDVEDPTHPGPGEFSNAITDFHRFLDDCVGRLTSAAGPDTLVMILSDHGHGRRAPLHFNVNQLLLEHGLLESRVKGPLLFSPRFVLERMKNLTLETLHRLDLEDLAYRFARVFPWTRKMKKRDFLTEPARNIATASEFGGTNPFGGIDINRDQCSARGLDYEAVRSEIIDLLSGTKDGAGERVFRWVKRREQTYAGPNIGRYPDILYEMRPEYGTNWSVHLPLVSTNPRHRKISGGHRASGVLIMGPLGGWSVIPGLLSPVNVCATVLRVLCADDPTRVPAAPGRPFVERNDGRTGTQ